jgi:hypothetical protein
MNFSTKLSRLTSAYVRQFLPLCWKYSKLFSESFEQPVWQECRRRITSMRKDSYSNDDIEYNDDDDHDDDNDDDS